MKFSLVIIFCLTLTFSSVKLYSQSATFTTPGTNSFVVPHGVTSISAQVWGAGGGGSKGYLNQKGTGGGGGGYASGNLAVNQGYNLMFNVGQGGTGASTVGTNGTGGGSTSVTFVTYHLTALGGGGGTTNVTYPMSCPSGFVAGNGGVGGNGSAFQFTSTVFRCGGSGANLAGGCSPSYSTPGGGGGGSAAPGGNGREAGQTTGFGDCSPGTTQNGGTALTDGGAGGNGGVTIGNGIDGTSPGGGGGGNAGTGNGGNGANGKVVLNWTCSNNLFSAMGTDNQSICSGESIDNIVYKIVGATGASVTGLPDGVNYTYSSGTVTISGQPSVTGTFNYLVTPTGYCTASTASGSISVGGPVKRSGICYASISDALSLGMGSPIEVLGSTLLESFTIPAGLTLVINNGATVTNAGTVTNNGIIQINPGGSFVNNGIYEGTGNFSGNFINPLLGTVDPGN